MTVSEQLAAGVVPLVRITGNGSGSRSDGTEPTLDVFFNAPVSLRPIGNQLFIRNSRVAEIAGGPAFFAESNNLSPGNISELEQKLEKTSSQLTAQLGCLPSSGLATVVCFLQLAQTIKIECMPLQPSFVRPVAISARQPLPCIFHNWLGERRLAKQLCLSPPSKQVGWQDFNSLSVREKGNWQADPLNRLLDVFDQTRPALVTLSELEQLADCQNECWLESLDFQTLKALEPRFFLPRGTRESHQWWLYDNESSRPMDSILKRLMWCQQRMTN